MKRRITLLLTIVMVSVIVVTIGLTGSAFATGDHYYDFESSLGGWTLGADPGVLTPSLTRANDDNLCPPNGMWYANLTGDDFENGRGAVWMQHFYSESGPVSVQLTWAIKDKGNAQGVLSRYYIGKTPPTDGSSFTTIGTINSTIWITYTKTVSVSPTGSLYVDLGWKPPVDAFKTISGGFDCVDVLVTANAH